MAKVQTRATRALEGTPAPKEKWRVTVDLLEDADVTLHFDSKDKAMSEVDSIFQRGYVIFDRSQDQSNYDHVVYPLAQVKSIAVYRRLG